MNPTVLSLLATMCFISATSAANRIELTGSSTIAPLMSEIGQQYEKNNKGLRVDIQSGGSSRGISDVRNGTADIGMVSRNLKSGEEDLHAHLLAKDGIAIIVHKSNPVQNLTDTQIKKIFLGEITDWTAVGGIGKKITVINKAEGRSTLEVFLEYFKIKNSQIKAHAVIGENEQGIKTVAANPTAIAYVSIGSAEVAERNEVAVHRVKLNGLEATAANVRNGIYPISRSLNLVTHRKLNVEEEKFLQFALSNEVKDLIEKLYFIPIQR